MFARNRVKLMSSTESYMKRYDDYVKSMIDQEDGAAKDETDRIPRKLVVRIFDLCCFAFAMLTYFTDVISDISISVMHFREDRMISGIFIVAFACISSFTLNFVSFVWICEDRNAQIEESKKIKEQQDENDESENIRQSHPGIILPLILCILQLGPLWWYAKALYYGYKYRQATDAKVKRQHFGHMVEAERDATLLRFFEGFIESTPQLIIQGYQLGEFAISSQMETLGSAFNVPNWVYFQLLSMGFSLMSVCWSISSQHRSIRMARSDKVNMYPHESVLQMIWRLLTVTSRFIVLVSACLAIQVFILPFILLHIVMSLIHLSALQSVDTGTVHPGLDMCFVIINAVIHIITPFNMADGPTLWRYATAYTIEFVEGAIFLLYLNSDDELEVPFKSELTLLAVSFFFGGLLVMILYYSCCHPNRRRSQRFDIDSGTQESLKMKNLTQQNSGDAEQHDHLIVQNDP